MTWSDKASAAWRRLEANNNAARRNEWLVALILNKRPKIAPEFCTQDVADKLRAAFAIYALIRSRKPREARELRQRHGYRRFLEMGRLWMKYEFSLDDAIDHLNSDLSISGMTMQIIDAHDPTPEWNRKVKSMFKWADVVSTAYDTPPEIREWAKIGRDLMEKYK